MHRRDNNRINFFSFFSVNSKKYSNLSPSEQSLLQVVKNEVESRLQSLLYYPIAGNFIKQKRLERLNRLSVLELKTELGIELLSLPTSILEIFERVDVAGRLLIVGKAGFGKTIMMLELAQELIQQAEVDSSCPIPIIFDLSSREDANQPISDWLVDNLKLRYGVRKTLGKKWLNRFRLIPLLDGLDEVELGTSGSHVSAINEWLQSATCPPRLAICSQWEEFEKVVQGVWQPGELVRLSLKGTLLLKPLTDEQILLHITCLKRPELWQLLQQDTNLLEITRALFWLNVVILSHTKLSLEQFQQLTSRSQRLEYLLNIYVEEMLYREVQENSYKKFKTYDIEQVKYWLSCIAQQMQQQKEFTLEQVQALQFLAQQKLFYEKLVRLSIGLIIGGLINLNISLGYFIILGITVALLAELFCLILTGFLSLRILMLNQSELSNKEILIFCLTFSRKWLFNKLNIMSSNNSSFTLETAETTSSLLFRFVTKSNRLLIDDSSILDFSIWLLTDMPIYLVCILLSVLPLVSILADVGIAKLISRAGGGKVSGTSILLTGLIIGVLIHLNKNMFGKFEDWLGFGLTSICIGWLSFVLVAKLISRNKYICFLNYCTERLLLQKVGKRYRFVHQLLLEHFAKINC
ncbi:NACHT domain-containing protein [Scytonema sp. NUACC26]|uniref:NACHT domain-containing protein n=1 Tax=Scytonema sp. NUACC26 TaxID=3140176 RepID=UPI0034DC1B7F